MHSQSKIKAILDKAKSNLLLLPIVTEYEDQLSRCEDCASSSTPLCAGFRKKLNEDATLMYGAPTFYAEKCQRMELEDCRDNFASLLPKSNLTLDEELNTFVNKLIEGKTKPWKITCMNGCYAANGVKLEPLQVATKGQFAQIKLLALSHIYYGYRAVLLNTEIIMRSNITDKTFSVSKARKLFKETPLVILDMYDTRRYTDSRTLDELILFITERLANNKPTILVKRETLINEPLTRTEEERKIWEGQLWKNFGLTLQDVASKQIS